MTRNIILNQIEIIIFEETNKKISLSEDHILIGSIGNNQIALSSIEFVKIIVRLESQFNVAIDFDVKLNTVKDIIDYIEQATDANKLIQDGGC